MTAGPSRSNPYKGNQEPDLFLAAENFMRLHHNEGNGMTGKLWSVNALSIEFNLDRRTVARRIAGIPPAGEIAGHPAWRLSDVAGDLSRRTAMPTQKAGRPAPIAPPGFERLVGLPAIDQIGTYALLEMVYHTPAQAGALAVASGATCEAAFALRRALMVSLSRLAIEVSALCRLQPLADDPDAPLFDLDAFVDCDWHALAQTTGEAVDVEGWERRAAERFAA
jgi:hypothetical protein